ncbi:hypothetical protein Tco_0185928 [Tanacetum coccineum]
MILPAKSENKKKVEDHPRTNKSVWTKVNRVDSIISFKRVVINSNSESVCKTCNKCLNSANHEMCVVNILNSVNATPTVKIVLNKGKQIWKPKGKLSDNSLNKTKQVWKATGKLFANVGYQWRSTGKKVALGKLNYGYQWRPTGKKFALGELCPLTKLSVQCCSKHMTGNRSKLKNFVEKFIGIVRFGNDHFRAIMGYGDYVIGDSMISRVYYIEGLRHNLFSVGQFYNSDLEVAFRKHYCFVRDINGADLLKVDEHWLTLSADLLRKALNVTPADSAHPFESPPAGKTDITFTRRRTTRKLPVVEVKRWIIASQDETIGPSVHPEDATSTKMIIRLSLPKKHLDSKSNVSFRTYKEPLTWVFGIPKDNAMSLTAYADADHADVRIREEYGRTVAQFLEIDG